MIGLSSKDSMPPMTVSTALHDDNVSTPITQGLLPAVLLSALVVAAGTAAFYAPPAQGEMAVVFPFGTDSKTAYALILAEGGRFVSASQISNVAIAYATDTGFADRIRASGALFTLAAHGLCAPPTPTLQG